MSLRIPASNRPMRKSGVWLTTLILALVSACASIPPQTDVGQDLKGRAAGLLERYAANDPEGVIKMLDPTQITLFGSDNSEVVKDQTELRMLMRNDFALWGSAQFGEIEGFDWRSEGRLATTFFSVPFRAGGREPIPVRFCMTWRQIDGQWLLTQSASAVPTIGSSAAELIRSDSK